MSTAIVAHPPALLVSSLRPTSHSSPHSPSRSSPSSHVIMSSANITMSASAPSPHPASPRSSISAASTRSFNSADLDFTVPPPGYVEPPSYFASLGLVPGVSRPARYACLSLAGNDRLRLVGFPDEDISAVVDVVDGVFDAKWGVQARTCPRQRVFEWKLKGRPWGGDGWNNEVSPVRLLTLVFSGLSTTGYHVTFASEVAYGVAAGRDTVFLKQGPKVQRTVFALTFRKPGTLLLVDAPVIVQNLFISCLKSWPEGLEGLEQSSGNCKIQLAGQLWPCASENHTFAVRELLCNLLAVFEELGYDLVASLDFTAQQGWNRLGASQSARSTLDSWFFATRTSPSPAVSSPESLSLSHSRSISPTPSTPPV